MCRQQSASMLQASAPFGSRQQGSARFGRARATAIKGRAVRVTGYACHYAIRRRYEGGALQRYEHAQPPLREYRPIATHPTHPTWTTRFQNGAQNQPRGPRAGSGLLWRVGGAPLAGPWRAGQPRQPLERPRCGPPNRTAQGRPEEPVRAVSISPWAASQFVIANRAHSASARPCKWLQMPATCKPRATPLTHRKHA